MAVTKSFDAILVKFCAGMIGLILTFGVSWKNAVDEKIYSLQRESVTQQQLDATLRRFEATLEATIKGMDAARETEAASFVAWLKRIELRQIELYQELRFVNSQMSERANEKK